MPDETSQKINQAVQECLTYCYSQPKPLSAVASCIAGLRRRPGWNEGEVVIVQQTVLRMLSALVKQPEDMDDPEPD
ncbi:MAG: hypothetical protein WD872_15960 [Pirellulaceae bacterium]